MEADFYLCDVCKAKTDKKHRLYFTVDRKMDAAGSMDDVTEIVDLCPFHMKTLIEALTETYDDASKAVDIVRQCKHGTN